MIGTRTRYSLAQFLELQEPMMSVVLLSKYGVQHLSLSRDQFAVWALEHDTRA